MRALVDREAGLPALTGARFFAALWVVVYHYGQGAVPRALVPLAAAGPSAVSFFYVLSGAVLTWGCAEADGRPRTSQAEFWRRRAARILPAYLLALALSLPPFGSQVVSVHPHLADAAPRLLAGLVSRLLLVQAFWPGLAAGFNTPAWSISCEAFFYAVWPRLAVSLAPRRPAFPWWTAAWLCAAAAAVPLSGLLLLRSGVLPAGPFPTLGWAVSGDELCVRTLSYFPPLRLPEFALGIVLGHALRRSPARKLSALADGARELAVLVALGAACCLLGTGVATRLWPDAEATRVAVESGALSPLFALLIWQLARGEGPLQRLLAMPWLLRLGEASYALYILQEPVVIWLSGLTRRAWPAVLAQAPGAFFWIYLLLLILLSLAVGRWVERPLRARLLHVRLCYAAAR